MGIQGMGASVVDGRPAKEIIGHLINVDYRFSILLHRIRQETGRVSG